MLLCCAECVRACMHACVHACMCVCVREKEGGWGFFPSCLSTHLLHSLCCCPYSSFIPLIQITALTTLLESATRDSVWEFPLAGQLWRTKHQALFSSCKNKTNASLSGGRQQRDKKCSKLISTRPRKVADTADVRF